MIGRDEIDAAELVAEFPGPRTGTGDEVPLRIHWHAGRGEWLFDVRHDRGVTTAAALRELADALVRAVRGPCLECEVELADDGCARTEVTVFPPYGRGTVELMVSVSYDSARDRIGTDDAGRPVYSNPAGASAWSADGPVPDEWRLLATVRRLLERLHRSDATGLHIARVPDGESARAAAAFMVERGYTVVRVRRDTDGDTRLPWRVTGLDEGPFIDDDRGWWVVAEERIASAAAGRFGGTWSFRSVPAAAARGLVGGGETVADRTVEEVRHARLAALAGEPARAPAPEIVHRLGEPSPADGPGPAADPVDLGDVDYADWRMMTGSAESHRDLKEILRELAANDGDWHRALYRYFTEIFHGDAFSRCRDSTITFFFRLVSAPRLASRHRMELLFELFSMALLDPGPVGGEKPTKARPEADVPWTVISFLPLALRRLPDAGPAERALLTAMTAVDPARDWSHRLPEFRAFRDEVDGPSPMLDLALALLAADDDRAADVARAAAAWDEHVALLRRADAPPRARHANVLLHLASRELPYGWPLLSRHPS